ncbi:MAG: cupin domain-containing protein [Thermodesulfobacteriota bacterium]
MEFFQELKSAPFETLAPGVKRFVFTLEKVMLAYFELEPGARIARHSHPHEQVGILIQGRTLWRMAGQERILEAPALYRVPSGEPHEVEVVGEERVLVMDAFSPVREDFLVSQPPAYMR